LFCDIAIKINEISLGQNQLTILTQKKSKMENFRIKVDQGMGRSNVQETEIAAIIHELEDHGLNTFVHGIM